MNFIATKRCGKRDHYGRQQQHQQRENGYSHVHVSGRKMIGADAVMYEEIMNDLRLHLRDISKFCEKLTQKCQCKMSKGWGEMHSKIAYFHTRMDLHFRQLEIGRKQQLMNNTQRNEAYLIINANSIYNNKTKNKKQRQNKHNHNCNNNNQNDNINQINTNDAFLIESPNNMIDDQYCHSPQSNCSISGLRKNLFPSTKKKRWSY